MKRCIVGASAALLIPIGLIASAPPAGAGCLYGGPVISKCDGPVQSDGTWQRCVAVARWVPSGFSSHLVPEKHCGLMGPGHYTPDLAFADPPTHIND
ncbi:CDGP domain-containing protein [Mycobacterium sp. 4D054]|uniref:CDGP domain-containing protein n=1 Tax=Mycobacterium sp. 4D054 TaxID=3457440 RepID=UPI003FD63B35